MFNNTFPNRLLGKAKYHGFLDEDFEHERLTLIRAFGNNVVKLNNDNHPDDPQEVDESEIEWLTFEFKKAYLEQWFCVIDEPFCIGYFMNGRLIRKTLRDIRDMMTGHKMMYSKINEKSPMNLIDLWLRFSPLRYSEIDFLPPPLNDNPKIYNLFQGIRANQLHSSGETEQLSLIKEHLRVMSNHDQNVYNYLVGYLGHLLKYPAELPRIALVFISAEGSGKGSFLNLFGKYILGNHYQTFKNLDDIVGRFADPTGNLLYILDEIHGKESYKLADPIKNMITEPSIRQEIKNIQPTSVANFGRYFFLSNYDNPVKISPSDRRFVVIKMSDEKKGNEQYFVDLEKAFKDDSTARSFYDYLIANAWEGIRLRDSRPTTEAYLDIQDLNRDVMDEFAEWFLYTTHVPQEETEEEQENISLGCHKYAPNELFQYFKKFLCETGRGNWEFNTRKFGIDVKNKLFNKGFSKKRLSFGFQYSVDFDLLKQELEK
jgi:hypothetical protein